MKYQVKLKAPYDMTEADYMHCGNTLYEERFEGIKYAIIFDSFEEAKKACIQHGAYGIIDVDSDTLEYVWMNPDYKSKSFEELRKKLGRILLPRI
ncbi:MAG: hypothetical protein J6R59_10695 [Paludibacteraceae bacterium]|nr:hypothetical protein [Paludibacteraceae bacterium]